MSRRNIVAAWLILSLAACSAGSADLAIYGDSTAIASRIPLSQKAWNLAPRLDRSRWFNILAADVVKPRRVYNAGAEGQDIAKLRDRLSRENRAHRQTTTIIYDRINSTETPTSYVETLSEVIALLETDEYLIVPQVPDADDAGPTRALEMAHVDDLVRQRWPRHTFTLAERGELIASLRSSSTRADAIHRNAKGQANEAHYIGRWLAQKGW